MTKNRRSAGVCSQAIAVWVVVVCSSLLGCSYKNQPPSGQQRCAASGTKRCPDNYHCNATNFCERNGSGSDGGIGTGGRGGNGMGTGGTAGTGASTGASGGAGAADGTGGADASDGGITPDAAVDMPVAPDGPVPCTAAQKRCNGVCVLINDPTYGCDPVTCTATACPPAAGGTLVCQGTACVVGACGAGTKKCGSSCVSVTDPAYGCGATTCDSSTCPAVGTGTLACQGTTCVVGTCGPGTKKCANKCVNVTDPTYGCGAATCDATACPPAAGGTLICQGGACVVGACGVGTKKCGEKCVPTDANNGCGDPLKCTACAANETCAGGAVTACQCVPNNTAACMGKACGPAINNCGQAITCTNTCVAPQTCNGGSGGVNGCGCTPNNTAACMGKACGPATNNCGTAITCTNTCVAPQTCNGGTAGVNGCGCAPIPMATACTGKCGAVPNGCGTNYTCGCATGQVCVAATSTCCTPLTKPQACVNKACGSVSNGCGGTVACDDTCTAVANTTVSCSASNQCVRGCAAGAVMLPCSTAANPACGRWDFESTANLNTEGWYTSSLQTLNHSALHPSSGLQSLAVAIDPAVYNTPVAVDVTMCTTPFNAAGKKLRAHLYFVPTIAGTPIDGMFVHLAVLRNDGMGTGFCRAISGDVGADFIGPDILLQGTVPATCTTPVDTLEFLVASDGGSFTGRVYVDDVRIE